MATIFSHELTSAVRLSFVIGTIFGGVGTLTGAESSTASSPPPAPAFVQRGLPDQFHNALKPLEGEWRVDKRIYIAVGSPEKPAFSKEMIARRRWVAGGRHLVDVTEGKMGDSPYYRLGVLGFSNIDRRYEWSTFDGMNANRMIYVGDVLQMPSSMIEMKGVFTDQGLIAESTAGKEVKMRTVIQIDSADRHTIELYLTPPGGSEKLIDKSVYERISPEPTSTPLASKTTKTKSMHFLVLLKVRPDATEEKQAPLRRSEAASVWRLLSVGVLRSINFTSGPGAALEFEVESETELRGYIDALPMVSGRLVDVQVLALKPFTGFEALFDSLP
jgi:hypothetical protein